MELILFFSSSEVEAAGRPAGAAKDRSRKYVK
jgi:hypothetical protein